MLHSKPYKIDILITDALTILPQTVWYYYYILHRTALFVSTRKQWLQSHRMELILCMCPIGEWMNLLQHFNTFYLERLCVYAKTWKISFTKIMNRNEVMMFIPTNSWDHYIGCWFIGSSRNKVLKPINCYTSKAISLPQFNAYVYIFVMVNYHYCTSWLCLNK